MDEEYLNKSLFKEIFVDQIGADIKWAIDAKRYQAAAQLLLSGVDVMAGLERPEDQLDTTGSLFINWCEQYMLLAGEHYTLNGQDLWGARCGFLHTYTPYSRVFREGRAKPLGYVDAAKMPVMSDPSPTLVIVSLHHLHHAFRLGMAATMKRINRSEELSAIVNTRMNSMYRATPLPPAQPDYRQNK